MEAFEQLQLTNTKNKGLLFSISTLENDDFFGNFSSVGYFSMVLVTGGRGMVYVDVAEYAFDENSLLCFSLYQRFKIKSETNFKGVLIRFHPEFYCLHKHRYEVSCNGVLFNNIYSSPVLSLPAAGKKQLETVVDGFQTEMRKSGIEQEVLLSYLKIFLISASRLKMEQQQEQQKLIIERESVMVGKLREAIDTHYRSMHSPGAYAKLLNISTKALNRISNQHFRKTLSDLIADRIIVEAKRELYLTTKQVKLIASELGYDDEFYFSRFFKNKVSVSPKLFRDTAGFDKANVGS